MNKRAFLKLILIICSVYFHISTYSQNITSDQHARISTYLDLAEQAEKKGDKNSQAHFYNKVAYEYWEANQPDYVIDYFLKSLKLNESIGNLNAKKTIYSSLGMIYTDVGKHEDALKVFQKSFDIARQDDNKRELVSALLNIALANENLKQYIEAIQMVDKALELSKELNNVRLIKKCFGRLADNYKMLGNTEKSLEYMNLYTTYNSYIHKEEIGQKNQQLSDAKQYAESTANELLKTEKTLEEVEQISRQRQMEIDLLTKDKVIAELKIQEQQRKLEFEKRIRNVLILAICITTFLLFFIIFIYSRLRKKDKLLKLSEEKFRTLFFESHDPFLLVDKLSIIECNAATVNLLGYYSTKEIIALNFSQLYPEKQPNGVETKELIDKKTSEAYKSGFSRFELVIKKSDGKEHWVDVSLTSIHYIDKVVLFTIWHDIDVTKREHSELIKHRNNLEDMVSIRIKELHESQLILKEQNQIKTLFIDNIKRKIMNCSVNYSEHFDDMSQDVVSQMLRSSDLIVEDKNILKLEKETLDVYDFLSEIKVLSDSVFFESDLEIDIQKHESLADSICVDKNKILYVITSILKNIIQYTEEGIVKFRVYSNGKELVFTISDKGKMFPEEYIPDFFINQWLYQNNDNTIRRNSIELCLSNQYVELHGGTMIVQSKEGEWNKFIFSLLEK